MKTFTYVAPDGEQINVKCKVNNKLGKKADSKLKRRIAATALAISVGIGGILVACSQKKEDATQITNPTTSATNNSTEPTVDNAVKEELRFNPNSKEGIIENAAYLIEEAAKDGKELDAKDAVLAVITANSNEISAGFMGQLFGERADQTYTYGHLVDAYLRVGMMQVQNIGIAKDEERAFNIENIFANPEDYNYLRTIRDLTTRFNNSTDKEEKQQITDELNKIAFDLCNSNAFDISSSAGILSMLSLDGMHIITANSNNPILHDDIRDEMFGSGDYACSNDSTFTKSNGQVIQTQYSFRVNDLKLDSVKAKLDNAVLEEGKTIILNDIINEVNEKTKDVVIANFDVKEEINDKREENRDFVYEYETKPGVVKPNYSEKTEEDVVENVNGKDVIVVPKDKVKNENTTDTQKPSEDKDEKDQQTPVETTPIPEGDIADSKQEAEEKLEEKVEDAQAEADKGVADGKYDGENGLSKRSLEGKSEYYVKAYTRSYDAYKAIYDAKHSKEEDELIKTEVVSVEETKTNPTEVETKNTSNTATSNDTEGTKVITKTESYDLNNLSKEELRRLMIAAVGAIEEPEAEKVNTL